MINKQTTLNLNGPILSFLQQPNSVSICNAGIATFVGIATATFPTQTPSNSVTPTGTISYQWYDANGPLTDGTNVIGSATTTLTVSNSTSPVDNGRSFYLKADYIPSAYGQNPITESTARYTGNAINDALDSNIAFLSVYPVISITSQPQSATIGVSGLATFTVEANLSDPTYGSLSYQWRIDGKNIQDGTFETETTNSIQNSVLALPLWDSSGSGAVDYSDISSNKKTVTISGNAKWETIVSKWYGGAVYFSGSDFYNISPTTDFAFGTGDFSIESWVYFTETGFKDIFSSGTYGQNQISFRKNNTSQLLSSPGSEQLEIYYNQTIVASGGNFSTNTWYHVAATRESGIVRLFINGNIVATGTLTSSISADAPRVGSTRNNQYGMKGYIQDLVVYKGIAKYTSNFTPPTTSILSSQRSYTSISGSESNTLSLYPTNIGSNNIDVVVSNPSASFCSSPIYSNSVNFTVVNARPIINIETFDENGPSNATLRSVNLDINTTLNLDATNTLGLTSLYAAEQDIDVTMELYGAKGLDAGGYVGGQGGKSTISFTMKKNEEYVISRIPQSGTNGGIFLYKKSKLIAAVGSGGNAGTSGNGGAGGGVNVAGVVGNGRDAGAGGALIASGTLPSNGIFGSTASSTTTLLSGDSIASAPNGGRTISCAKGNYWRTQGYSACQDIGAVKFYRSDGSVVSNTATINRGFKAGYSILTTSGAGTANGGNGGGGSTGGNGGSSGAGGGGGSGYTDGSITVVSTQQGGNTGVARVFIKPKLGNFYVDSVGRILILSAATPGKDPSTLTKTTGRVLIGTDTCIDDTRWQNFLNLASTSDYRLTATLNNSTTKIINASPNNIQRMKNANYITLKTSLTDWQLVPYPYTLKCLAWDETSIDPGYGSDYSILSWGGTSYYYGYYGQSSNPFFSGFNYSLQTANWWILPPGVPDF
jgi:hypothetical protein